MKTSYRLLLFPLLPLIMLYAFFRCQDDYEYEEDSYRFDERREMAREEEA